MAGNRIGFSKKLHIYIYIYIFLFFSLYKAFSKLTWPKMPILRSWMYRLPVASAAGLGHQIRSTEPIQKNRPLVLHVDWTYYRISWFLQHIKKTEYTSRFYIKVAAQSMLAWLYSYVQKPVDIFQIGEGLRAPPVKDPRNTLKLFWPPLS